MNTVNELKEIENKTIACKKMVIENEDIVSIDRFYIYYTEDPIELSKIKESVGVKTYYEIISIWNKA